MDEFDITSTLEEFIESGESNKFAIYISKEQYVMAKGFDDHAMLARHIYELVRPDIELDEWGNILYANYSFQDESILGFGWTNQAYFFMPENSYISEEQYKCFKGIIDFIEEHNKNGGRFDYEVNGFGNVSVDFSNYRNDFEVLFEKLEPFVKPLPCDYEEKEVIIGKRLLDPTKHKDK